MSRDQRVKGNWALLHACEKAKETGSPVAVAFNLVSPFNLPAFFTPKDSAYELLSQVAQYLIQHLHPA